MDLKRFASFSSSESDEIEIFDLKIVGNSRNVENGIVTYVIQITTNHGIKVLYRRFSEFVALRAELLQELRKRRTTQRAYGKLKEYEFPSRFVLPFTHKSDKVIAERSRQLQRFLKLVWRIINRVKVELVSVNMSITLTRILYTFLQLGPEAFEDGVVFTEQIKHSQLPSRKRSHMYTILEQHQTSLHSF